MCQYVNIHICFLSLYPSAPLSLLLIAMFHQKNSNNNFLIWSHREETPGRDFWEMTAWIIACCSSSPKLNLPLLRQKLLRQRNKNDASKILVSVEEKLCGAFSFGASENLDTRIKKLYGDNLDSLDFRRCWRLEFCIISAI